MHNIELSDVLTVRFPTPDTPDSTPTADVHVNGTSIGSATVAAVAGSTKLYEATFTVPASGIADGAIVSMLFDAVISAANIPTVSRIIGVVGLYRLQGAETTTQVVAADMATEAYIASLDIASGASLTSRSLIAGAYFDPSNDAVANVTLVDTVTTNTDLVSAAAVAAAVESGQVGTDTAAIQAVTDQFVFSTPNLVDSNPSTGILTGPNATTVQVVNDDDSVIIEGATVRLYRTGESGTKETDGSGEAVFATDSATFSVAITASGFDGFTASIAISGDSTVEYRLTPNVITPPTDPELTLLLVECIDDEGAPEEGVVVSARMVAIPTGGTGHAYLGTSQSAVSVAGTGLATLTVVKGATYQLRRGSGTCDTGWVEVTAGTGATTTVADFIGE